MSSSHLEMTVAALKKEGIAFDSGLRPAELREIEKRYDFRFPPDLCEFLSLGLAVSPGFPNWRTDTFQRPKDVISIAEHMNWPLNGICFDIEHDNFWMQDWAQGRKTYKKHFTWREKR